MNQATQDRPIALVTGADRGFGLALTTRLLVKGWRVIAGYFLPDWPDLATLAAQYPESLVRVPLDVSDDESVHAAAQVVLQKVARVDLVINNAGVTSATKDRTIREPQDFSEIRRMYDVNSLGPLRVVTAFLPLTDNSSLRRLCFVSSEAGSINRCTRKSWYGYCMSKAALNMAIGIIFSLLRADGYTFRVYHPGWLRSYMSGDKNPKADMEPDEAAIPALAYFLRNRASDPNQQGRTDEDRLVMSDWQGREWPW